MLLQIFMISSLGSIPCSSSIGSICSSSLRRKRYLALPSLVSSFSYETYDLNETPILSAAFCWVKPLDVLILLSSVICTSLRTILCNICILLSNQACKICIFSLLTICNFSIRCNKFILPRHFDILQTKSRLPMQTAPGCVM